MQNIEDWNLNPPTTALPSSIWVHATSPPGQEQHQRPQNHAKATSVPLLYRVDRQVSIPRCWVAPATWKTAYGAWAPRKSLYNLSESRRPVKRWSEKEGTEVDALSTFFGLFHMICISCQLVFHLEWPSSPWRLGFWLQVFPSAADQMCWTSPPPKKKTHLDPSGKQVLPNLEYLWVFSSWSKSLMSSNQALKASSGTSSAETSRLADRSVPWALPTMDSS